MAWVGGGGLISVGLIGMLGCEGVVSSGGNHVQGLVVGWALGQGVGGWFTCVPVVVPVLDASLS